MLLIAQLITRWINDCRGGDFPYILHPYVVMETSILRIICALIATGMSLQVKNGHIALGNGYLHSPILHYCIQVQYGSNWQV